VGVGLKVENPLPQSEYLLALVIRGYGTISLKYLAFSNVGNTLAPKIKVR